MRKIKNCMKIALFLLGILVTLTNCEKEEPLTSIIEKNELVKSQLSKRASNNESEDVLKAKLWFEQNQELNIFEIFEITKTIDWEQAFVSYNNDEYVIEVPLTLDNKANITHSSNKKFKTFNRLLIIPSKKE